MRPRLFRKGRSRGQALVEFALVAPLFFIMLFAIIEGARFVFYNEMLNSATREGARYAIVHGSQAIDGCPSGPMPGGAPNPCDPDGDNVIEAVEKAAIGLVGSGFLFVDAPVWCATPEVPPTGTECPGAVPPDRNTGDNARGKYVTVFVDYTYAPLLPLLPEITISARSTLVVNN
jgi:hypothetical protein